MSRPLVAVSGPSRGGRTAWHFVRRALRRAGAEVVRLTPGRSRLPRAPDALLLPGGADVDPRRSGAPRDVPRAIDPARDGLEWGLLDLAHERGLPVLGICRGAQLLNVYHGGSLRDFAGHGRRARRRHLRAAVHVFVRDDSRMASILGSTHVRVNALHHQTLDVPGRGVRVVARDPEGVPQGVEIDGLPFAMGVQWHPEYLPMARPHQRLFQALVEQARRRTV